MRKFLVQVGSSLFAAVFVVLLSLGILTTVANSSLADEFLSSGGYTSPQPGNPF